MSELRDDVVFRIQSMLSQMSLKAPYNPKIFKVDQTLRQVNERAYDPGLVAIGPIHHNKDHLKDMEQLKVGYLYEFLQRKNQTVERYVVKMRELEGRARNCYSNFIHLPETDRFVEMLLLDAFFVIVLLWKFHFRNWRVENEYITQHCQARKRVKHDLLLVENQLPFFVLSQLFDMIKSSDPDDNLSLLVKQELCPVVPWRNNDFDRHIDDKNHVDCDHLLGMVYRAYFSSEAVAKGNKNENLKIINGSINTASELEEAGIKFKMVKGVNPMDVSFTSDGVMQIPYLMIEDYTETVLRNFIAYEQMLPNNDRGYVSGYLDLITCLVNSSQDVEILRRSGIFDNMLGDDETIHLMFNQLGKHVIFDRNDFRYMEVYQNVNRHCSRRRNKWMAMLRRNYFNSPWATLSVIAAIVLLLLTTVQTFYSVLSYEN